MRRCKAQSARLKEDFWGLRRASGEKLGKIIGHKYRMYHAAPRRMPGSKVGNQIDDFCVRERSFPSTYTPFSSIFLSTPRSRLQVRSQKNLS